MSCPQLHLYSMFINRCWISTIVKKLLKIHPKLKFSSINKSGKMFILKSRYYVESYLDCCYLLYHSSRICDELYVLIDAFTVRFLKNTKQNKHTHTKTNKQTNKTNKRQSLNQAGEYITHTTHKCLLFEFQ